MLKIKTPLDAYYMKISLTEAKLFEDCVISKAKTFPKFIDNILSHNNFNYFEQKTKNVGTYVS